MKKLFLAFTLIMLAVAAWVYRESLSALISRELPHVQQVMQRAAKTAGEIRKEISAPPPLYGPDGSADGITLTRNGVLTWTNSHRKQNGGLAALTINARLNAAAEAKVMDMFAQQYFEHESPDGKGPDELANTAGYAYVAVGENLALGNFADDKALVQAWMDSPGHRANILSTSYREIGIAVAKGMFEGRMTWLAVQEFGRPLSDCPSPSKTLKSRIETEEAQLDALQAQAEAKKQEIDSTPKPRTREEADAYNRKVDEYNALVAQINAYVQEIKGLIAEYNRQVRAFNECAEA